VLILDFEEKLIFKLNLREINKNYGIIG